MSFIPNYTLYICLWQHPGDFLNICVKWLWDEKPGNVRPGYGLYDRALGVMYMLGVWDMLDKLAGK